MHSAFLHPVPGYPTESEPLMNETPTAVPGNSGPGWSPPLATNRERMTESMHFLVTPSVAGAFDVWAERRGLSRSAAVRALVEDALWREVRGEPLGALYGDFPASMAHHIVASSQPPETVAEA